MKKVNVKNEILIVLFITLVIVAISTRVFASSPIQIPTINTNTNSVDTNTVTTTTNTTVQPTNTTTSPISVVPTTNTTTPVTTNTTVSTYQDTSSLPQTGDASDYAIFALIAVSIVVAVYAYKKVRDYNI